MEEKEPTPEYIKGFNQGYILHNYKPELATSLSKAKFSKENQEYLLGFKNGISQRELEQTKEKFKTKEQGRENNNSCLLYTSPSPRDQRGSRMPSSA